MHAPNHQNPERSSMHTGEISQSRQALPKHSKIQQSKCWGWGMGTHLHRACHLVPCAAPRSAAAAPRQIGCASPACHARRWRKAGTCVFVPAAQRRNAAQLPRQPSVQTTAIHAANRNTKHTPPQTAAAGRCTQLPQCHGNLGRTCCLRSAASRANSASCCTCCSSACSRPTCSCSALHCACSSPLLAAASDAGAAPSGPVVAPAAGRSELLRPGSATPCKPASWTSAAAACCSRAASTPLLLPFAWASAARAAGREGGPWVVAPLASPGCTTRLASTLASPSPSLQSSCRATRSSGPSCCACRCPAAPPARPCCDAAAGSDIALELAACRRCRRMCASSW